MAGEDESLLVKLGAFGGIVSALLVSYVAYLTYQNDQQSRDRTGAVVIAAVSVDDSGLVVMSTDSVNSGDLRLNGCYIVTRTRSLNLQRASTPTLNRNSSFSIDPGERRSGDTWTVPRRDVELVATADRGLVLEAWLKCTTREYESEHQFFVLASSAPGTSAPNPFASYRRCDATVLSVADFPKPIPGQPTTPINNGRCPTPTE